MLFPTYTFLWFLLVVIAARWGIPRRAVLPTLLAASYVFYLSWGPIYGTLLAGTTVATWVLGQLIERDPRYARLWLTTGLVICLTTLAFFKYAAFLVTELYSLVGLFADAAPPPPELDIVLPLGVSFFLFQMISYLVDVHRGTPSEPSLFRYALYISFFPQLVAGPIVRPNELLPQLAAIARGTDAGDAGRFDPDRCAAGVDLILRGLIKKVVIADNLAAFSDLVFKDPTAYGQAGAWIGVLAYAGQIYGDFSGYTDMARGAGKLLGFELPENFALPYLASSITDFWRRWHITLSRWLRDYLYIPLGGNRRGRARRYFNLMATMGLGGLWHGAAWTFVIWGVYHGLLLILHQAWLHLTRATPIARVRDALAYRAVVIPFTFALVCLGWIVFRAPDTATAFALIGELAGGDAGPTTAPAEMTRAGYLLLALAAGHYLGAARWPKRLWAALPSPARGLAWAVGVAACYFLAGEPAEFIYFQF